ncbi:beta-glucosidase [Brachybacterium sp. EF45031]|uniref:glycoside hydrolase family 3 N-terminal domain-containing protein n=1 Tax=Brachybacterium sillae TaxID=2810536 RepID=UPI00217EC43E|nr:glycoside hydrolase family 3 N-terminal domain-containing protein [Brachybacterium sillae]MCS6712195.1 beta-glucosidase [Brachybacterium sillae]
MSTAWDRDVLALLMASFTGTEVPAWLHEPVQQGLGAVILFGYNTPDTATAGRLARQLHGLADEIVVAIDEEGGDVTRLQAGTGSSLPTAWAFGRIDDEQLTRSAGRALGRVLAACDIDLDLAPVLDVSTDPANPVIGTRAYGDDPQRVARHASAAAEGLRDAGVGTCGKHFPGHGATAVDSHTGLPVIDLPREQVERAHLAPWRVAPAPDAVMTAHVLVPALGEGPASISTWSRPLLEGITDGTDPFVITDALDMAAVSRDPGYREAVVRAVEAGADLLCLGTSLRRDDEQMLREAHDALTGAVADGRLPRAELTRRAARTRHRLAALRARRRTTPAPPLDEALTALHQLGAEAARRAVTLPAVLRGPASRRTGEDASVAVIDVRRRPDHASGARAPQLEEALREAGRRIVGPADADLVLVLTRLPRSDAEERAALDRTLERHPAAIIVHTGVPAAAPEHDRVILSFGAGRAMMRAAVTGLG